VVILFRFSARFSTTIENDDGPWCHEVDSRGNCVIHALVILISIWNLVGSAVEEE
jgi:hypothetical protein